MEKPSKIPKFDPAASSDLLSRISSFLPELQAANERLAQEPEASIVDANLAEDKGEDDSDGERGDDSSGEDKAAQPQEQTIELRLAVGDVAENPGIAWLADQAKPDDEKEEGAGAKQEDEKSAPGAESTISLLLNKSKPKQPPRKGPLIQELD